MQSNNSSVALVKAMKNALETAANARVTESRAAHAKLCQERWEFWGPTMRELEAVAEAFPDRMRVFKPGSDQSVIPGFTVRGNHYVLVGRPQETVRLEINRGTCITARSPEELLPMILEQIARLL